MARCRPDVLRASGVSVRLAGRLIIDGADLRAEAGQLVAVVGPNGAGKSTLVRAVAGIQPMAAGSVLWDDRPLAGLGGRQLARLRAFVPQRGRVPQGVRVGDAVMIGRSPHIGPLRRPGAADRRAVREAMERCGVDHFADRQLATLSGGELQRVHVAVALAQEAPALVADEPTAALDLGATAQMARLLRGLADGGIAVVVVVHDLALATAVADAAVIVDAGRVVAAGPPEKVLTPARLGQVWRVDARLQRQDGHTALHVAWLDEPRHPAP